MGVPCSCNIVQSEMRKLGADIRVFENAIRPNHACGGSPVVRYSISPLEIPTLSVLPLDVNTFMGHSCYVSVQGVHS
jgi:hypothetical protein